MNEPLHVPRAMPAVPEPTILESDMNHRLPFTASLLPRRHSADSLRLSFAMLILAAAATASHGAHAESGTIHFSGRIVEPPCAFGLDATHLQPRCARPASAEITFADALDKRTLATAALVASGAPIALPAEARRGDAMVVTVNYR
ncbi:hypothetical protein [Burkholderia sp. 3C]